MYIILDTNILIHYNSFEDIPWRDLMGCDELTFVFPALVIEEVDKVKDRERGRVQRRAKAVSSRLGQLLVDEVRGKYPVLFVETPLATSEEQRYYNLESNDNMILFSVYKAGIDHAEVCLVSSDNAMLMRAKRFGFKKYRLDDKYLAPVELTPEEKEAKQAIAELERMKHRMPKPKLEFFNESCQLQIKRAPITDIEKAVSEEMEMLKEKWPEKSIDDGDFYFMGQCYRTLTTERVATYNCTRRKFLEQSEKKIRLEVQRDDREERMKRIEIIVANDGTASTGRMDIFLDIPENIRIYKKKAAIKWFTYEEPQTPNELGIDVSPITGSLFGYRPPSIEMWDLDEFVPENELKFKSDPLTHNLHHPIFAFYVDSALCPNFKMRWVIADSELVNPAKGELNVSFVADDKFDIGVGQGTGTRPNLENQ